MALKVAKGIKTQGQKKKPTSGLCDSKLSINQQPNRYHL